MYQLWQNTAAQQELQAALEHGTRVSGTRRFREIDLLERYYRGTQYEGRPGWWDNSADVPLQERAPCVQSHLPKAATEEAIQFTLGEKKFPGITYHVHDGPRKLGGRDMAVNGDDAKKLQALTLEVAKQIKLRTTMREAMRRGLSQRTAVALILVRRGQLCIDMLEAKYVEVIWADPDKTEIEALDIRWLEPQEVLNERGQLEDQWFYRRRVIDAFRDVAYVPFKVEGTREPVYVEQPVGQGTIEHNTGFCPVLWMPNFTTLETGDEDGVALYEDVLPELAELDCALSVRHTGNIAYGTPQAYETGTAGGENAPTGRPAQLREYHTTGGGTVRYRVPHDQQDSGARRRSAHTMWSYMHSGVGVGPGLLEVTGNASESVGKWTSELRSTLLTAMRVVLVSPSEVAGAADMSGKLLEMLHAPLLALVDDLREVWGAHLRSVINTIFRFCVAHQGRGIFLPGLEDMLPLLARQQAVTESGEVIWLPLDIDLDWGPHFSPTPQEVKAEVEATKAARGHGDGDHREALVTRSTAMARISRHFGNFDAEAELAELEKEDAEQEKLRQERSAAEQAHMHALMNGSADDEDDGDEEREPEAVEENEAES